MSKLKDGAFTGSKEEGNPYKGGLEKGISYDTYEAGSFVIEYEQNKNRPIILPTYRTEVRRLTKYLPIKEDQRILDLGSGTGISALEILLKNPKTSVLGVEESEGMFLTAQYKFHQIDEEDFFQKIKDNKLSDMINDRLLQYWQNFKSESEKYKDQVEFIFDDFQETDNIEPQSIDSAIGNQFMHWTNLSESFSQLYRFLKGNKEVVWNSASHFYNDPEFPVEEYGFRYNDFLNYVLDEVSKKGLSVKDYKELSRPEHNLESLKKISKERGFETELIELCLKPVDLQVFVKNHVPVFVRQLVTSKVEEDYLENITKEAIAKAINNPYALEDTKHKYEIVPVFRSVKT